METILTTSNAMFALGILGVIFSVYHYFKNPQINSEKEQIKIEENIKDKASKLSQKEVENKAVVLEKQFQWYMESTQQKFCDMGKRLDDAFLLAANHTNTVDKKVDKLVESTNALGLQVEKLSTIIEERIPRK